MASNNLLGLINCSVSPNQYHDVKLLVTTNHYFSTLYRFNIIAFFMIINNVSNDHTINVTIDCGSILQIYAFSYVLKLLRKLLDKCRVPFVSHLSSLDEHFTGIATAGHLSKLCLYTVLGLTHLRFIIPSTILPIDLQPQKLFTPNTDIIHSYFLMKFISYLFIYLLFL